MSAVQAREAGKKIDWAGIGWMFLFFWYFSGVTHLMIQLTERYGAALARHARDVRLD